MSGSPCALNPAVLASFKPARTFQDQSAVSSIDFSRNGRFLLAAGADQSLLLYSVDQGAKNKTIFTKRIGSKLVHFGPSKWTALMTGSNGWDHSIRYLSLYDNRFLRYFKGHTNEVISLSSAVSASASSSSPVEDFFLSCALDGKAKLWDFRSTYPCVGTISLTPQVRNMGTFDPEGLIFAVAGEKNTIKLFDIRKTGKGPFSTFEFSAEQIHQRWDNSRSPNGVLRPDLPSELEWTSLDFSPDGKSILCSSSSGSLLNFDSFTGAIKQSFFEGFHNRTKQFLMPCFSPDNQFILTGDDSGNIVAFSATDGSKVQTFSFGSSTPITQLKWCPDKLCIAAVQGGNTLLMVPEIRS